MPGQPLSLDLRPTVDTIVVGWIPPSERDIRVRGYVLGYGKGVPDIFSINLSSNTRFYTITGLGTCSFMVLFYIIGLNTCSFITFYAMAKLGVCSFVTLYAITRLGMTHCAPSNSSTVDNVMCSFRTRFHSKFLIVL